MRRAKSKRGVAYKQAKYAMTVCSLCFLILL